MLVEDYAAEGKSLARHNGKVVFIENVVPGDIVDIRLTRNKKDWAEGVVTRFREYSKERVTPFCSHFGVCGGCQWQMLPYPLQLQYKQKQVTDNLQRIGKLELPEMEPIAGAAETVAYRNKIEYTFSNKKYLLASELHSPDISSTADVAGFHVKGLFDKIIDIDTCHLQQEPTNRIRIAVKNWAIAHGLPFYDIRNHQGWLRTMQLRICVTGEMMVNIMFGYDDEDAREQLLTNLLQQFPGITTLLYTVNPKQNDSLYGLEPIAWHGPGFVVEQLQDFRFKIGPKSFFQTNTRQGREVV